MGTSTSWDPQGLYRDCRQCTYKRNKEALACKYCCNGKAMCYIFCVCVCSLRYPAGNAHAQYYIVICGLPDCHILPHFLLNGTIFRGKMIEHKMFFDFFPKFVRNISHFKNNSARYCHEYALVFM